MSKKFYCYDGCLKLLFLVIFDIGLLTFLLIFYAFLATYPAASPILLHLLNLRYRARARQ